MPLLDWQQFSGGFLCGKHMTKLTDQNLFQSAIEELRLLEQEGPFRWSARLRFTEAIPADTYGVPGIYEIFYRDQVAYVGISASRKGKRTYGIHDRIQKKATIVCRHYDNPAKIHSLKETWLKKALEQQYEIHHSNWQYRYCVTTKPVALALEMPLISMYRRQGLCALNTQ